MGAIIKIGNEYYIEFMARGLKYQQKAGTDEQKAKELLASIEEKIRLGEMNTIVRDVPTVAFWKDFEEYAKTQYPKVTAQRLIKATGHFAKFLAEQHKEISLLSQVTPKVVENYKFSLVRLAENKRPDAWVINFTLLLLREMLEYALKLGFLNDNPTLHIRFVADDRRYVPKGERTRLAKEALERRVTLFRLAELMKKRDVLRMMPYFRFMRDPLA